MIYIILKIATGYTQTSKLKNELTCELVCLSAPSTLKRLDQHLQELFSFEAEALGLNKVS